MNTSKLPTDRADKTVGRAMLLATLAVVAIVLSACEPEEAATPSGGAATEAGSVEGPARELRVLTHDSFSVSDEVLAEFEALNNVTVQILEGGDTGSLVNKAILAKGNPVADVLYGVDNTFLSRALDEEIFEAYESPLLADIPAGFHLDAENRALPVDFGDVCLNYDKEALAELGVSPPTSLADLTDPAYDGLVVTENPATSSPGLAFLLGTIGAFGEAGYLDYWRGLVANDVRIVNDWETAYYTEFTRAGGTRPIVVSYASSPPFEVIYAEDELTEPPTAAVVSDGSCFRQIEFVGILTGGRNRELAEAWVDFMLSPTFQEDIPLQMFVFPVNRNAELDAAFVDHLQLPEKTAEVSAADIAANREQWIAEWTEAVLR